VFAVPECCSEIDQIFTLASPTMEASQPNTTWAMSWLRKNSWASTDSSPPEKYLEFATKKAEARSAMCLIRSFPVLGDDELVVVSETIDTTAVAAGKERFKYCFFDDGRIGVTQCRHCRTDA